MTARQTTKCGNLNYCVAPNEIKRGEAAICFAIICEALGLRCATTPTPAHDMAIGLEQGGLARGLQELRSLDMAILVDEGYLLTMDDDRVGGNARH